MTDHPHIPPQAAPAGDPDPRHGALIRAAVTRARVVIAMLVFLLICGIYAYHDIPKESDPDINIPIMYVTLHLEGVSPDDGERLLVRPVEQELTSIEGVKEMRSTAYQGGGNVILEFEAGFDSDQALYDVRQAVDRAKPELPLDADEPEVSEVNFSLFPVLVVTLSGDMPERSLVRLARDLQDKIVALPPVLEANISGDREELLEIVIDPELMESYGLNGTEILNFVARSNKLVTAGNLDTGAGRFAVKVPGLFETARDILDLPIKTEGDSVIRVGDIATLNKTFKDPQNFAMLNGRPAVAVNVVKRTGENIIETIEAVQSLVTEEQKNWPSTVQVHYTLDRSTDIRNMLRDLQNNIISAIILVMIVIVAALGVRSAGLVGIAIPGAFLSGVLIVYMMGLTVNIVVLFSLILSVGMLVDGAIVVTEYADRRMREGATRRDAYSEAATRMAWPIISSTATTLAAFAPLLFWPGIAGQFMRYMPITLIAVLSCSLVMALLFVPVLGALIGKPAQMTDKPDVELDAEGRVTSARGFTGFYARVLDTVLRIPGLTLLAAAALLIGSQVAYGTFGKGVEFFPDIEPQYGLVLVHARGNLSVYEQRDLVRRIEHRIHTIDGIKLIYTEAGKLQSSDDLAEDVIGKMTIEMHPWGQRPAVNDILEAIRRETADFAGLYIETRKMEEGPAGGKAAQIQVSSVYPERLPPMVELIYEALEAAGDFRDIEDSRPLPGIEWEMQVDRAQASKFGIDLSTVGEYIRMITNGMKIADYRPDDSKDEIDIVIRHARAERTLDQLDRVRIQNELGSVPISNFVERKAVPAIGTIHRVDQKRVLTVKADLPPGVNIDSKIAGLKDWLEANKSRLDPMVRIEFKGEDEDQKEAQGFLVKAFIVALFIMGLILVAQFNSFYSALLILSAVIMSTIGVMLGLILTQQPFGIIMSGVGVIALAGIIVNNNIVLIDTFDHLHKTEKIPLRTAIMRTGIERLRPVMLTTVTTVLGLMPMVLQANVDFIAREVTVGAPSTQWWAQLATAIAFGLTFSTLLTLLVTPAALMMKGKARSGLDRLRALLRRRRATPGVKGVQTGRNEQS